MRLKELKAQKPTREVFFRAHFAFVKYFFLKIIKLHYLFEEQFPFAITLKQELQLRFIDYDFKSFGKKC